MNWWKRWRFNRQMARAIEYVGLMLNFNARDPHLRDETQFILGYLALSLKHGADEQALLQEQSLQRRLIEMDIGFRGPTPYAGLMTAPYCLIVGARMLPV